ncbi:hypothetical protein FRC09_018122 [Ceratobasidium sp. 395]|nr:hypothetical protein FRC09_018122 [Ceratobasidium sp. 395]
MEESALKNVGKLTRTSKHEVSGRVLSASTGDRATGNDGRQVGRGVGATSPISTSASKWNKYIFSFSKNPEGNCVMTRSNPIARKARRSLVIVNGRFHLLDDYGTKNSPYSCPHCKHPFKIWTDRNRHIMAKPECRERHMVFTETGQRARRELAYKIPGPSTQPHPTASGSGNSAIGEDGRPLRYNDPRRWSDNGRTCHNTFVEHFPGGTAGSPISNDSACPRNLEAYLESCGRLADPETFEAAELLMTTGMSGVARTRHLQSSFYKGKTPWANSRQMVADIDRLPHGPDWSAQIVSAGEGRYARDNILYKRPVVDAIRELFGNPAFKEFMRYAPERHWTSAARRSRVRDEMWTGDWCWGRQMALKDRNGTIIPLIAMTDKTNMTKLSGNQAAHPVYLTIGNISKSIRRQATKHATVVIGYLPVDSFGDVPSKALRQRLRGQLLHWAMHEIMAPLEEAGRTGVEMWGADGRLRRAYPLLASFVGDYPEQCDMACTDQGGCPKCLKRSAHGRGDERRGPPRTTRGTLAAIDGFLETGKGKPLSILGLKKWWPWWANLPDIDFATCITPDLLHQIHKGVFMGHALRWIQRKLGKPKVDERFASMTRAQDLRHFKRGISVVKQWTGREAKEMEKVFVPLIAEDRGLPDDLVAFLRSLLDFSYIARSTRMTDGELDELRQAHAEMHRLKHALVTPRIYQSLKRLDGIPKWHMISHYVDSIRDLGTPDGYNTEAPEYLHIVYVKRGWAASNKRDAIPQIIDFCQRLEALRIHRAHLNEYYGIERKGEPATTAVLIADEDGGTYEPERKNRDEEAWEDELEEIGNDGEDGEELEGRRRATQTSDTNEVYHPAPEFAIAMRPTCRATLAELTEVYGATSLERALKTFLRPYARGPWFFLPSETFGVWRKLTLYHHRLPFAPSEPRQRDVIRVRPPEYDNRGRTLRRCEPAFDTALFVYDSRQIGITRAYFLPLSSCHRLYASIFTRC